MDEKILEGKMWVQKQHRISGQDVGDTEFEESKILVDKFETEPAKATCSIGLTLSIGSYEFVRLDVGVTIPCYKEELSATQKEAFEFAAAELMRRRKEVMDALGN